MSVSWKRERAPKPTMTRFRRRKRQIPGGWCSREKLSTEYKFKLSTDRKNYIGVHLPALHVRSCTRITDGRAIILRKSGAHKTLFGGIARYAVSRRFGRYRSSLVSGTSTAHARSGRQNVRSSRVALSCNGAGPDYHRGVHGLQTVRRVPKTRLSPCVQSYIGLQCLGQRRSFTITLEIAQRHGVCAYLFHSSLNLHLFENCLDPVCIMERADSRAEIGHGRRTRWNEMIVIKKNYQNQNRQTDGPFRGRVIPRGAYETTQVCLALTESEFLTRKT